jgi:Uma2 family endonuclease
MATTPRTSSKRGHDDDVDYPTSDGRPMAETDLHRQDMVDVIETLQDYFAADPTVYVSGNLLLFYERGNKRRHVAPDAFVVRGVEKRPRDNYLLWDEGKGPDVVIEITSKTTRREDERKKLALYRGVLKVPEYFQFDPIEEYLRPSLQGHRLRRRRYAPIEPVLGRLPSEVLGLHLERDGTQLRLFDPQTGRRLVTRSERASHAEAAFQLAEAKRLRAEAAALNAETRARLAEAENERLRREVEEWRRRSSDPPPGR